MPGFVVFFDRISNAFLMKSALLHPRDSCAGWNKEKTGDPVVVRGSRSF